MKLRTDKYVVTLKNKRIYGLYYINSGNFYGLMIIDRYAKSIEITNREHGNTKNTFFLLELVGYKIHEIQ